MESPWSKRRTQRLIDPAATPTPPSQPPQPPPPPLTLRRALAARSLAANTNPTEYTSSCPPPSSSHPTPSSPAAMADVHLTSQTRFLPPLRASSPNLSPRRAAQHHRRLHSLSDDAPYDVSPVAILHAFADGVFPPDGSDEARYLQCARGASSAQKGLVIRAAEVAIGARDWVLELRQWVWPGGFDAPAATTSEGGKGYAGSLPAAVVEAYEERVEEIQRAMAEMDIEELKGFVLDIHGARSRPGSSYERRSAKASLNLMDDVSLLVTGTMVQALPVLTVLNQLLDAWSVRLAVLRGTPGFLRDLDEAKRALVLAWEATKLPKEEDIDETAIKKWKNAVDTIAKILEEKASSLGQRLDGMLDSLEGREDVIPDSWIDDFENLESAFGRWTSDAHRGRIQLDIMFATSPPPKPKPAALAPAIPPKSDRRRSILVDDDYSPPMTPKAESFPSPPTFSPRDAQATFSERAAQNPERIGLAAPFTPRASHGSSSDNTEREPNDDGIRFLDKYVSDEDDPVQRTPRNRISQNMSPESGWKRSGLIFADTSFDAYDEEDEDEAARKNSEEHAAIRDAARPAFLKRASTASIESFTRDQVRSITVSRRNSASSTASTRRKHMSLPDGDLKPFASIASIDTSLPASRSSISSPSAGSLPKTKEEDVATAEALELYRNGPMNPIARPRTPNSSSPPSTPTRSPLSPDEDESPSIRPTRLNPLRSHPPLNMSVKKLRKPEDSSSSTDNSTSVFPSTPRSVVLSESDNAANVQHSASPKKTRHVRTYSSTSNAELEKQISDILTTVPVNIRLTSGITDSDSTSSNGNGKSPRSTSGSHRFSAFSAFRSSRNSVKSPELTLSPVKQEDRPSLHKQSSMGHSDIKLYHLIQPGRDKPIKLFIRRVGDNGERVMVRVGGGWADLGEYLRGYAEHHGRRTVSSGDGKFEVLTIDPVTGIPISPQSTTSRSASRSVTPLPDLPVASTPPVPALPQAAMTPTSASATAHLSSRLTNATSNSPNVSTPDSAHSNTSKTSWRGDEVGLAGPATKKLDLSNEKLEWIEGMMSQARRISGGVRDGKDLGRSDKEPRDARENAGVGVADLGRVGGTRRVYLRGAGSGRESAAGGRADKEKE